MPALALALALALGTAAPAAALPVDVFFDGPELEDEPGDPSRFGLSEAQALAVERDFGIDVLTGLTLGSASGLTIDQGVAALLPGSDPTQAGSRASATWSVDGVPGPSDPSDPAGTAFLLFTHSDPFENDGVRIDYADPNIGLTIDGDLGWFLVKATVPNLGDFYYPAIRLDGSPFTISWITNEALEDAPDGSGVYQLPELQVGLAVPEPASALLLAGGLWALARRRSSPSG